jgi:general secretion pathway protein H
MQILVTGNNRESGFTLIEILIVITIMAIVMSMASLAIPNHEIRYWREDLDHLTGTLNLAAEESAAGGLPITAEIDSQGWRFYQGNTPTSLHVLRDVYAPQQWHSPVEMESIKLVMGNEFVVSPARFSISQKDRQAFLIRKNSGIYYWTPS